MLRTTGEPENLLPLVRETFRELDPALPLFSVETLDQALAESIGRDRFTSLIVSAFAVVALGLSLLGVYGLLAYSIARRRAEIGVRVALGATERTIARMVVVQGMTLVGIGTALGLASAAAGSRLLASQLFGVSPLDGVTFAGVASVVLLVAFGATLIPPPGRPAPTPRWRCRRSRRPARGTSPWKTERRSCPAPPSGEGPAFHGHQQGGQADGDGHPTGPPTLGKTHPDQYPGRSEGGDRDDDLSQLQSDVESQERDQEPALVAEEKSKEPRNPSPWIRPNPVARRYFTLAEAPRWVSKSGPCCPVDRRSPMESPTSSSGSSRSPASSSCARGVGPPSKRLSTAVARMVKGIRNSTHAVLTRTAPTVANARETECPTVKAVMRMSNSRHRASA